MKPIARIRSDFATKFGIPRQSGVVGSLQAEIVSSRSFAAVMPCAGWRRSRTSGSSGSFPKCARRLVADCAAAAPGR